MHRALSREDLLRSVVCLCSGLAVTFSFWPYRTGFIAYFVLIPFIIFSGLGDGRGRFLRASYIFGLGYFFGNLYWIAMLAREQIALPWLRLPATLVLCAYLALFMLLVGFLTRRMVTLGVPYEIALALAWGGVEYLRSLGPLGFPWASLGYSQTPYPAVAQQAAVVGTYGLSAWLVLLNGLIARLVGQRLARPRRAVLAIVAASVFALPVACGKTVLSRATLGDSIKVALVQPNIEGAIKWDTAYRDSTVQVLGRMTSQVGGQDLIVWPETAVPLYVKHTEAYLDTIAGLARSAGSPILTGFPDYERTSEGLKYYNSAMLLSPAGEILGEYRKIHLVPFGEMIPFEDRIPLLRNINFGEGDFSAGSAYHIFEVDSKRFGVAVCFESIYPGLVRRFVGRGAAFIVNITNDEWFGPSAGPYQHAQMAVMRCVEGRVALARCANTGLSMLVDPYGRVRSSTELFRRGILAGELPLATPGTFYVRWGYIVELMLILIPAALACLSYAPLAKARRRRQNGLTDPITG